MVHPFFLCAYFTVQVAMVYSQFQDFYNDNNLMVIGNLKRREVRPLNPYFSPYSRRRYGADAQTNLNYRRTRDIREKENFVDRRFELSEAQLREEKINNIENLENIHNELRWLTLDDEDGMENKVDVAKPKSQKSITTFPEALRATVIIGQVFSLLPFVGVFTNVASKVKFVRTSWKCVYSLLSLIGQMFMAVLCVNKLAKSNVSLTATSPVIFYVTTCVTMLMFFQVARRWPELVQHIAKAEDMDPNFDCSLTKKCNITCAVVLILASLEHILSLISAFAAASACFSSSETYEGFVRHFYPWVFNALPYSIVLGVITQFLHFQSTFIWNFSDLFVICMSYYLTSRLNQVNKKLLAAQGKYLPEIFWRVTREDYCRATQIVRKVDGVISSVVFISFANNLFFICLQLFNTLEDGLKGTGECTGNKAKKIIVSKSGPLGGHEAATYFLFSLVYLLSRSVAVSLIASQVNSASAVPAPVLYDVPSPVYCVEVQRFLDQVNGDKVALSGLQFFSVTRGLLLTVAGTIVTYELVMFQFNSSSTPTLNITSPTLLPAIAPTLTTTTLTS